MSPAHVIVDVFTDTPLQGNQLAVSDDGPALSDDQMQRLRREMRMPAGRRWRVSLPGEGSVPAASCLAAEGLDVVAPRVQVLAAG